MRTLQQLTCMVGKDEYKEKSWSGDVNLVSIMNNLVVCLLSLCRLSIAQVLDVLTPVICAGRELVGDWRAGSSPRLLPQSLGGSHHKLMGQVPNGPG